MNERSFKTKMPLVGVIMGSDSDLFIMKEAAEILESFGIHYEITIISAHRTPDRMAEYAKSAKEKGIQVVIAGAGGSAHLPGMTAAQTTLPVIGVPIKTKTMEGLDSLLSIVQMPFGIPVATVAINGAKNAALIAVSILSLTNNDLAKKLEKYRKDMESSVLGKAKELEEQGFKVYGGKLHE